VGLHMLGLHTLLAGSQVVAQVLRGTHVPPVEEQGQGTPAAPPAPACCVVGNRGTATALVLPGNALHPVVVGRPVAAQGQESHTAPDRESAQGGQR